MKSLTSFKVIVTLLILYAFGSADALSQTIINVGISQPSALVSDAGMDTIVCIGEDSIVIGGSPSAMGGTANYSYSWFPPTDLSSITSANPKAKPASTTIYVLTVTDANNCSTVDTVQIIVDPCTGFAEFNDIKNFDVYPNPSNGHLNITFSGNDTYELKIINTVGALIHSEIITNLNGKYNKSIDLTVHPAGIYFVKVSAPSGRMVRKVTLR